MLYKLQYSYSFKFLLNRDRKKQNTFLNLHSFSVNEKKVSDGAKGCDRAALLFDCVIKTAPKVRDKTIQGASERPCRTEKDSSYRYT